MLDLSGLPEFTPAHARTLTELQISKAGPGTVLRDFEMMLSYLQERPMPVTARHQLTRSVLPDINARLAHPLQIDLKRSQPKSYPPILGLYVLLRASGLTYVAGTAKKPLLFLDPDLYRDWMSLNPTEQYGSLLEAWLVRGSLNLVGEPDRFPPLAENFLKWLWFHRDLPDEGRQVYGDPRFEKRFHYVPGWHILGLLELFGLIAVTDSAPDAGGGRRIDRIARTPLGDALSTLLGNQLIGQWFQTLLTEDGEIPSYGLVHATLQPYMAQWQRNLRLPTWEPRPGAHLFDVRVAGFQGRLAMPATATLDDLADAILGVLRFDNDHLYEFLYNNRFGSQVAVHHPQLDEGPWTRDVTVGQLPLAVGQTMTFIYDFGDWWEIEVTLRAVDPAMAIKEATLLEERGTPPVQYSYYEDEYDDDPEEGMDEDFE